MKSLGHTGVGVVVLAAGCGLLLDPEPPPAAPEPERDAGMDTGSTVIDTGVPQDSTACDAVERCNLVDDDCDGRVDESARRCADGGLCLDGSCVSLTALPSDCVWITVLDRDYLRCARPAPDQYRYKEARELCDSLQGVLASFETSAEAAAIQAALETLPASHQGPAWIGLTDFDEGNFVWESGAPLDYADQWCPMEPSNALNPCDDPVTDSQDCVVVDYRCAGLDYDGWDDQGCCFFNSVLCEME